MKKAYQEQQEPLGSRGHLFTADTQDRIGPGVMSSPHYHFDRYEMIGGIKGDCDVKVDGMLYRLRPKDVILFEPGQVHEVMALDECTQYLVYKFAPCLLRPMGIDSSDMLSYTLYDNAISPHRNFFLREKAVTSRIMDSLWNILHECAGNQFGYETAVLGHTSLMFTQIMREWYDNDLVGAEKMNMESNAANVLRRVLAYINMKATDDIRMEDVARYCGMSYSGFSRFFTKNMHEGFSSFVQRKRVKVSIYELMDNDDSLSAIAERTGFSSMAHFCTCFKRYMGMTPGEYRKQMKSER